MQTEKKADTKQLDQQVSVLQKNLGSFGDGSGEGPGSLFKIIHFPGWTTPVQVAIAAQILEAMTQQVNALNGLKGALQQHVEGSVGA